MTTRRTLIAAAPALALAGPALGQVGADLRVRGSSAYSESAMVTSVAQDGSSALTLRFCRFPEADQTWLWCHLVADGELYAFTRHDLPSTRARMADLDEAAWRAPPADAELVRVRRGARPPAVRLAAELGFHRGRAAPHGPGPVAGKVDARFLGVTALAAEVREGRQEVYGFCEAQVEIGGRRFRHQGLAKFHEQRQAAPRFEGPFSYGWFAGENASATTLLVARGASGGWILDGREEPLADMVADPPAQVRTARWKLSSGRTIGGRLEALMRYEIPVFDRRWQGSFVRGEAAERPIVGVLNDWTTTPDIYAAARARG